MERERDMEKQKERELYWQGSESGHSGELTSTRDGSSSALNVSWFVDEDLNQTQTPQGLTGRHVSFMRCSCRVWLCLGCVVLQTVRLTHLTSTWLNVKMARGSGDCSPSRPPLAWCTLILPKGVQRIDTGLDTAFTYTVSVPQYSGSSWCSLWVCGHEFTYCKK